MIVHVWRVFHLVSRPPSCVSKLHAPPHPPLHLKNLAMATENERLLWIYLSVESTVDLYFKDGLGYLINRLAAILFPADLFECVHMVALAPPSPSTHQCPPTALCTCSLLPRSAARWAASAAK